MAVNEKVKVKSEGAKNMGMIKYFKELKAEFHRITWAPKEEIKKAYVAVLVFAVIFIVYTGIVDGIFKRVFDLIF